MDIVVLKAKLHKIRVTHVELQYDGSCAIDGYLLDQAGIHEYEQIQIYNLNNSSRLTTYAIRAEDHSGIVSMNGAAAHWASVNDQVIICSYVGLNEHELINFSPTLVYLDQKNQIREIKNHIPTQVA